MRGDPSSTYRTYSTVPALKRRKLRLVLIHLHRHSKNQICGRHRNHIISRPQTSSNPAKVELPHAFSAQESNSALLVLSQSIPMPKTLLKLSSSVGAMHLSLEGLKVNVYDSWYVVATGAAFKKISRVESDVHPNRFYSACL